MGISSIHRFLPVFMALAFFTYSSSSTGNSSSASSFKQTGKASFYADKFQSRTTASGERFDQSAFTAAHKKLAFGTRVKVTNTDSGKSVIVRINDRGPFIRGRIIDLSRAAFIRVGDTKAGVINVVIEVIKQPH